MALASVQKCLALPPGFSLCAVSERALRRSRGRSGKGYYFDFIRLKSNYDKHMPMATPSISHMFALQEQFRRMESEGYEQRFRRHREMGARVRDWAGRKFGLFAEEGARSETVTCITNTRAIDVSELIRKLADRGFGLGNGYGKLKEKTFRVGHMGDHTVDGIAGLLEAIDAALSESG